MNKNEIVKFRTLFKDVLDIDSLGFNATYFYHCTSLLKEHNDLVDKIDYDFYYPETAKSLNVGGFSYSKVSMEVNKILESIASRVQLVQMSKDDLVRDIYEPTILTKINTEEFENSMKPICEIRFVENGIFYEERMLDVTKMFKKHLEIYMQPFFDSFVSLQEINDKIIDKYPENELGDYFFKHSNLKATIIMKICDNPRYNSFTEIIKERIREAIFVQGQKQYLDYYNVYCTLLEYLQSTEYKQQIV
jgi:hypothetical protein